MPSLAAFLDGRAAADDGWVARFGLAHRRGHALDGPHALPIDALDRIDPRAHVCAALDQPQDLLRLEADIGVDK